VIKLQKLRTKPYFDETVVSFIFLPYQLEKEAMQFTSLQSLLF